MIWLSKCLLLMQINTEHFKFSKYLKQFKLWSLLNVLIFWKTLPRYYIRNRFAFPYSFKMKFSIRTSWFFWFFKIPSSNIFENKGYRQVSYKSNLVQMIYYKKNPKKPLKRSFKRFFTVNSLKINIFSHVKNIFKASLSLELTG